MAYSSTTDFLALLRNSGGVARLEQIPGLDYVVAAMARAGMFRVYVGQSAPTVNQATTVWLQTSLPSWVAEGVVFLWNAATQAYVTATPELWNLFLSGLSVGYSFQSVNGALDTVDDGVSLLAIQRAVPAATTIILPTVASRNGKRLQIADWSTGVVNHIVTLGPNGAETIMQRAAWQLYSTADQLAGISLQPSTDLNGWVIAP